MSEQLDLAYLRAARDAAAKACPAPWTVEEGELIRRESNGAEHGIGCWESDCFCALPSALALYFEALDPDRVGKLLDRLERAEAQVGQVREICRKHNGCDDWGGNYDSSWGLIAEIEAALGEKP